MIDLDKFFSIAWQREIGPKQFEKWVEQSEERAKRLVEAFQLLKRLRTSWRDQHDPGKGAPYVFLVRDYKVHADERNGSQHLWIDWCDAFHAYELVDDMTEAQKGATHWREKDKRYPVPLGYMHEMRRDRCAECSYNAYVLGLHWQSCDSPYGDTWTLQLIRVCPHCARVHRFAQRTDSYRMTGLLKPPQKQ